MKLATLVGFALALAVAAGAVSADTLKDVKARTKLNCGVNTGIAGFAEPIGNGDWKGFDVAICRAVADAVLGDPKAVEFFPLDGKNSLDSLASGAIDLLSRNTTWTFTRDSKFDFAGVDYYDGQGFMVPKSLGVTSAKDLDGRTVCIRNGTTSALNLADFFRANKMKYQALPIDSTEEARKKYLAGTCDVYATDASGLAAMRATFAHPEDHLILPEIISKEPLGPVVRQGDDRWADIVRWSLYAMIAAEEHGITSKNVEELGKAPTDRPEVNRILGTEGNFGEMLGLDKQWAYRIIRDVGNYGEVFEANIGVNTRIGLARGLNAQWKDGGLLYAMPFR